MSDPIWYREAETYRGIREGRGAKNNPQVLAFYKKAYNAGIKADSVPWCAAFVGACLEDSGYRSTRSLLARSYLNWGKKCKPKRGAIVVFKRGNSSWQGHVGFVERVTRTHVYCLGGNQRDAVNVSRYPRSKVLGFRWPRTVGASRTLKGAGLAGTATTLLENFETAQYFIGTAAEAYEPVSQALETVPEGTGGWIRLALFAAALIGVAIVVWAYIDDTQNKRLA